MKNVKCKSCSTEIPKPGVVCESCYTERLEQILENIADICVDYDGCKSEKALKRLIDEILKMSRTAEKTAASGEPLLELQE